MAASRRRAPIITSTPTRGDFPLAGTTGRLGPLGSVAQFVVGWGFTFAFALSAALIAIATLGRFSTWLTPLLLRFWARTMFRIERIDLYVEGTAHVQPRAMKVSLFNHTSLLDAMIVTACMPTGSVAAIKREALFIPFVGLALWALGFLLIDRGRTDRAKQVLARAAERMQTEQLTVFIAPEGTRGADGELQPFKKGPFHIARVSGAPLVPMLIDGGHLVHPLGRALTQPGVVRVRFLPPIATDGLTTENMGPFVERVHGIMRVGLDDLRRDPGGALR